MANLLDKIGSKYLRSDLPEFRPGDRVKVHLKIREGQKERTQAFEGICIKRKRAGHASTVTVRKISFQKGVERVFPLSSPRIEKIEVMQRGRVRRSKLYYLRELRGKKARIRAKNEWVTK